MKFQFSIRYKILTVLSLLLSFCVLVYLLLAVHTFKDDKNQLVYDLSRSRVSNLSVDLGNQFKGIADKLEIFAFLAHENQEKSLKYFVDLMRTNADLAYVGIYDPTTQVAGTEYYDTVFAETYGVTAKYFREDLPKSRALPFREILQSGEALWNASVEKGPPLIGYARSVIKEGPDRRPIGRSAVVCYMRADNILKNLAQNGTGQVMVANRTGEILVHSRLGAAQSTHLEAADRDLIERAVKSGHPTSVLRYVHGGEEQLGAYSRTFNSNLIVASRIDSASAFSVVDRLISRSVVFSLIIVTLTFIAAILFSRSITRPLDILVNGMESVGHGRLDTRIDVHTRDEISVLAKSFNQMIQDLQTSRDELEKINAELEQKVKDRTKKLEEQNHAVKQAQEALLRTTRLAAVGEIAGRAAHEVLNPLTSLMTRVQRVQRRLAAVKNGDLTLLGEILQNWRKDYDQGGFVKLESVWGRPSSILEGRSIWDEDLHNFAEVIGKWESEQKNIVEDTDFLLSEAERISRIVQGMRSLSVVKGTKRPYHAHQLLSDSRNIMADLFEQSRVQLDMEMKAEKDLIVIDKDEFIQSVTNLMRNALQAILTAWNDSGQGRLLLSTTVEANKWCLDIVDNGVGIAPDDQRKLFENNFSTKSPEEGTGLGLSISRRFIRAYGGDIVFVSCVPRSETIFRITMPLSVEPVQEVAV